MPGCGAVAPLRGLALRRCAPLGAAGFLRGICRQVLHTVERSTTVIYMQTNGNPTTLTGITRYLPFRTEDIILNEIVRDYDMDSTEERIVVAHDPEAPGFIAAIISDQGHYSGSMWDVHPATSPETCPTPADAMAAVHAFRTWYAEGAM